MKVQSLLAGRPQRVQSVDLHLLHLQEGVTISLCWPTTSSQESAAISPSSRSGAGGCASQGAQGVRVLPFHEVEPYYTGHALVEISALHRALASPVISLPAALANLGGGQAGRLLTRSFPWHNTTGQTVKAADVICPTETKPGGGARLAEGNGGALHLVPVQLMQQRR